MHSIDKRVGDERRRPDFEQYDSERIIMARWLRLPDVHVCDHGISTVDGIPARPVVRPCNGDVLIVPSLWLHDFALHGRSWAPITCLGTTVGPYLARLRLLYDRVRAQGTRPVLVIVETFPLNVKVLQRLLKRIHELSRELSSRIVIGATGSNINAQVRRHFAKWAPDWREGAAEELRRREMAVALGVPINVSAPLIVSLPYSIGVSRAPDWHAAVRCMRARSSSALGEQERNRGGSNGRREFFLLYSGSSRRKGYGVSGNKTRTAQWVRPLIVRTLEREGARYDGYSTWTICGSPRLKCAGYRSAFAYATRATFCIEPPGDSLDRSHLYLAVISGCVPVLWNGGHHDYLQGEPVWWPWREARPLVAAPLVRIAAPVTTTSMAYEGDGAEPECAQTLNYAKFAISVNAERANSSSWIHELRALEADGSRLAAMRTELRKAANTFRYALRECGSDDCDAFALFRGAIARAWRASRTLM